MTSMDDYYTTRLNGKVPANFLANTSTSLDPVKNATTDILNKIGLISIIRAPSIDNPYARYIATDAPFGAYIENLAIGQATAEVFNPKDCTKDFRKVGITSWYAQLNDSYEYNVSTSTPELRKGVHDSVGLTNVADGITDSMVRWARNDMVAKFSKQFARVSVDGADQSGYTGGYEVIATEEPAGTAREDTAIALDVLEAVIKYVNEFKTLSSQYNKLGALMTTEGRPDVIMTRQMYTYMRQALGQTYHLDGFDIDADIVQVGSLPTPTGTGINTAEIGALVVDKRAVLYHPQWMDIESDRCVRGRYTNFSLAGEGTFNFLWGYNAVAGLMDTAAKAYTPTPVTIPTA